MPYSLQLFYQTVPTDQDECFGTSVTIDDFDSDSPDLVFRYVGEDAPEEDFRIALEEWPLLIEAVAKLTAARGSKTDAFKPAVTKEFLYEIDFIKSLAIEVLSGNHRSLMGAFCWPSTAQGQKYWENREEGEVELSNNDKALLQSWVDAAEYYEKGND